MMPNDTVENHVNVAEKAAAKWPYVVGLVSAVMGVIGLALAPISGIVYASLPGIAFATYHAFASHSPARAAMALSAGILSIGLAIGVVALYSFAGDNFFVQEWAAMAALLGMPVLGTIVGLPALTLACFRPGHRGERMPVGQLG